jgi:hypothetical protein
MTCSPSTLSPLFKGVQTLTDTCSEPASWTRREPLSILDALRRIHGDTFGLGLSFEAGFDFR